METKSIELIFARLAPDNILILNHDQGVVSVSPAEKLSTDLFNYAKMISELPNPSWLHLVKLENQPVFVLSHAISQNQTAVLTFDSTTRIRELEEKLVLLQDSLNNQTVDPLAEVLQDLSTSDLKTSVAHQAEPDDLLSIFSDLESSAAKAYPTEPSLGDTQPVSI